MEKTLELGARLEACAEFVREGRIPADVGTDHAYLPIWLVLHRKVNMVYASDINDEPVRSAMKNINFYGLSEKIITFTADGLEKIPRDKVDDIIIAGMGGDNIAAILSGAQWLKNRRYRLILQPMSRASRLREYLYKNRFDIVAEKAVCEAGRIYTIICAEYSDADVDYSDYSIYAGKLDSSEQNASALMKKQAGILRSVAEGCAAKGDISGQAHFLELAKRLENNTERGQKDDIG